MPGGVVTWPVYEGFQIGEKESHTARNAFSTFIPISAESTARKNIIFDFFDLLAAIAAHGKVNGLGGRKLSRLAGWWAFEHSDDGNGFSGGYKSWTTAADASSHLFFAYLRSLSPEADPSKSVIERIPRSLQALLASTEYPPETPSLMQRSTPRVVMLVETVSPTPFALLRRAKHFEYRDRDRVLREYSEFDDPLDALTDENKRVLNAISSINSSAALSRPSNLGQTEQETWSAFQNLGFSDLDSSRKPASGVNGGTRSDGQGLRSQPRTRTAEGGRPTTPSWADFLSSGFAEDGAQTPTSLMLRPDQRLPPISSRAQTPSYAVNGEEDNLAPGELAAIANVELDDAFWWVWMTSLAGEEPAERKAVFGRCALVETSIMNGRWLVMEEQMKGASPDPAEGVYIAPKKSSIFSFTKRNRNKKAKTEKPPLNHALTAPEPHERLNSATPSKSSLAPDQHHKIRAAAAALAQRTTGNDVEATQRRGRYDDAASNKTSSMLTMGMMNEASPAMKWASAYDKDALRKQYLGDDFAGVGPGREEAASRPSSFDMVGMNTSAPALSHDATSFQRHRARDRDLPALPQESDESTPAILASGPPAPLPPKAPVVGVFPVDADELQHEAEEVPLPATTPAQSDSPFDKELRSMPRQVGRKPVPHADNLPNHPAFRQQAPEPYSDAESAPATGFSSQPQTPPSPHDARNAAQLAAQRTMEGKAPSSSPESTQNGRGDAKPKKQGGGGLKKIFGRMKDNPNRMSRGVPRSGHSNNDLLTPPSESSMGRTLSWRGKPSAKSAAPNAARETHSPVDGSEPPMEPTMPSSPPGHPDPGADMSRVDTQDANPEHEFARFDQGPTQDTPSPGGNSAAPARQQRWNTDLASRIAPQRRDTELDDNFVTPMERGDPTHDDAESETTMDDRHVPDDDRGDNNNISPPEEKDRWAQIRENAAKRAAAAATTTTRASEEQSTQGRPSPSMRETDDGETSGEESESPILFPIYILTDTPCGSVATKS